ncbi:MAG TPA: sodium/proton-translocating pyrophosphatase, partial [Acidimicrobiales bacterium]|nr:sodium/proton-translocating pyrophosphatase [Acidimicrobiales bacterium]
LGMWLATRGNVRTTAAATRSDFAGALQIAIRTGGVCGLATAGLGLLVATLIIMIFQNTASAILVGFGFGGSLLALFLRVGGGIFTKAADVGADLVGKVEAGIPEDDPRNPATIADNVGDNVGDCAGMASDLFESYEVTLVASIILGVPAFQRIFPDQPGLWAAGALFPLAARALGVLASIVGVFMVRARRSDKTAMAPINRGFLTAIVGVYITKARAGEPGLVTINRSFYISAVISAVLSAVAAFTYLPGTFAELGVEAVAGQAGNPALIATVAVIIGIVLAAVILWLTGYFTGTETKPTKGVAQSSLTGAATVILAGISVGFESAVYTALVIAAAVYGAFLLSGSIIVGLFAIALAGCGLLTTVGVIVAMDTFGPVSDNAQGVAEMSGEVSEEGAQILTELDAVGNTTKAITKGIAIATAVLAATALFGSYSDAIGQALREAGETATDFFVANVVSPGTLVGMLIGAAVVFLFSGLAVNAVARAAGAVVMEVRRQFRDLPGIMEGTTKPEYGKVVDICTRDSMRELATPGLLALLAPIAVGFGLGVGPLAGYLAGTIATGTLMAVFLANSGGAWDNAKKIVEDGTHGGKGSPAHEATVIGDTVGDPFKDTAGPAINPLLKVMNLVSLLIAPAIVTLSVGAGENAVARYGIAAVAVVIIVAAVLVSKRRESSLHSEAAPAEKQSV